MAEPNWNVIHITTKQNKIKRHVGKEIVSLG